MKLLKSPCLLALLSLLPYTGSVLHAADSGAHGASPSGGGAAQVTITVPEGLKADIWAGAKLLANPVAFTFDEQGRMFVAETYRQGTGVPDNRGHAYSLEDDIAAETIEDRIKKYEKWQIRTPLTTFTNEAEQVRLIEDKDGDGVADSSHFFAGPFNEMLDGTAAGILAKDGDIWLTCIPHVWRLQDKDGDGKAEVKDKVFTGFGVRDAFRGHDLHGLILGPDGRIYFSMADRGYNIEMPDGSRLTDPMDIGRGGVFRCWPDGTGLERYAKGLRNPQELAFDELGNLFTVDNNSDSEDQARLVHVVEGGDSGWCMTYQYGTPAITTANYNRGPWNAEGLWHTREEGQAAWILPPLGHFTNGPSGLVYEPGVTAIGDQWKKSFFVCDFKGTAANSGIWNFTVEPDGAGFKLGKLDKFIWNVLVTDCNFGYDGRLYLTDFIDGWNGTGEGRVFAVSKPELAKDAQVQEVKSIFAKGFAQRSVSELVPLLSHADMRVRIRAQYALVEKADAQESARAEIIDLFVKQVETATSVPAKLHGVWGLGALRQQPEMAVEKLIALLSNADEQVRIQTVRALGDSKGAKAAELGERLIVILKEDASLSVKSQAALALHKLLPLAAKQVADADEKQALLAKAFDVLRDQLAQNADKDLVLRHALSFGLASSASPAELASLSGDKSRSVRLGAVLALRELISAQLTHFLGDEDKLIVTEAARAIYDLNIAEALPALAEVLKSAQTAKAPEALTLRAVNAAYRVGTADTAKLLADWSVNAEVPDTSRREALWLLAHWAEPANLERVVGFYRPLPKRDAAPALNALQPYLLTILNGSSGKVADEGLRAALALHATIPGDILIKLLQDDKRDVATRTEALRLLAQEKDPALAEALITATKTETPAGLRVEAALLQGQTDAKASVSVLQDVIQTAKTGQKQAAIRALAALHKPEGDAALVELMKQLLADNLAPSLQLDVLEAAKDIAPAKELIAQWEAKLPVGDIYASYRVSLEGGDVANGRELFANHTAGQCMRCHKVNGGGGLAGPELSGVGLRSNREYLLESLINPSAKVVPGYGAAMVTLKDGSTAGGILKSEDQTSITLQDPSGKDVKIPLDQIASRVPPMSSMPPMFGVLNKRELRDLVAYLATLGKKKEDIVE